MIHSRLLSALLPGTHGTLQSVGGPGAVYLSDDGQGEITWVGDADDPFGAIFDDASGWIYTAQNGTQYAFDANGNLTKMTDAEGRSLTFTHNGVISSTGVSIVYHRDAQDRITSITDPAGNSVNYGYDDAGNLTQFFNRTANPATDNPTMSYSYAAGSHYVQGLFDARGIQAARNYYDAQNRLYETIDAEGKKTVFSHDINGRTETITDRAGNVTVYQYDTRGNVTYQKAADGTVTQTSYHLWSNGTESDLQETVSVTGLFSDNTGKLVQQTYTTHYAYEDPNSAPTDDGHLRRITDPLGHVISMEYDSLGNLLTMTDARSNASGNPGADDGQHVLPEHHPARNEHGRRRQCHQLCLRRERQPAKRLADSDSVDPSGNVSVQNVVTSTIYDANGFMVQSQDALGHATTYTNDANGNHLKETTTRTNANGQVVQVVTENVYDDENRLIGTWDANHPRTSNPNPTTQTIYNEIGKVYQTIDALGHTTTMSYDDRGNLAETDYADGTSEQTLYDSNNRRQYSIDRRGKYTYYAYDSVGRLQETWFCNSSTTPVTRLSHTDYDGSGRVYQSIDADGNTTTSIYDSAGRRIGVVDANGNSSTYGYDENGNQTAFIDANGHEIDYGYDALNRRVQTVYPVSSVYVNGSYTNTATDVWTAYDELGRKIAEYEQSPVSQPLASRNIKRYVYDVDGRLTDVIDALGQDTHYAYDELGNETLQRDANQHSTTYTYDNLGRRISRTLPAGQVESTHYDDNGNLQTRTDFNGRTTTFQYDALNRLRFRIPDPFFNEQTVEWRYTASGQRERMIDSTGTTIYSYDDRDRLTSKATPEGTLGYGYDDQNNLKSITSSTPGGAAVTYTYDALNRLSTVNDVNNQQTIYHYDAVGNLGSIALPNGVTSVYNYDALNRLSTLTHTSAAMITAIASYAYGVFPTGQRQMAAEGTGRTSVYSYDALWRLQGETITGDQHARNGALGYGYDPVGNRKARTSSVTGLAAQSFTYDSDDRVNGDTYDSNGNTVVGSASQPASAYATATGVAAPPPAIPTGATNSASTPDTSKPVLGTDTYDSFDRLVKRTGATGSVQITYNGDGEKVAETITQAGLTVTTTYLVDELNPTGYSQVLEESTNGSLSRVYTFGLELISQDEVLSTTGSQISWTATYYGYDGHGNVRFLTNGAGAITDAYDFDAFGNLLNVSSGGSGSSTPNAHLYCGEQFDSAIGQYYLRARVMNPLTGRFWTMDTFEAGSVEPRALHKYAWANCDAVNNLDRTGKFSLPEISIGTAIIASVAAIYAISIDIYNQSRGATLTAAQQANFNAALEVISGASNSKYAYIVKRAKQITWRADPSLGDGAFAQTLFTWRLVVLTPESLTFEPKVLAAIIVHETTHTLQLITPLRGGKSKKCSLW